MKQITKEKIIDWVKILLNYKPESTPFTVNHRDVQIQDIQWIGVVEGYDHEHHLKETVARQITQKIIDQDLIKIKSSLIGHSGMWASKRYQVSATLSVVRLDGGQDFEYDSGYYPDGIPT